MSRQRPTLGKVTSAVERVAARHAAVQAVHAEAISAARAAVPMISAADTKTGQVRDGQ